MSSVPISSLLTAYSWNTFFEEVKNFGSSFIDNNKCIENSKLRGDTHTIIYRLIGSEIPRWIQSAIPENIIVLQIFAIEPNSAGLIHKDGVDRLCAFNIPILNCDQGTMDWFDSDDYSMYSVENPYTTIRITNEQLTQGKKLETTPIHSTLITLPSLVNTNEWHRVDNRNSPNFRWMLSLRFKNNPMYTTVKEKFNQVGNII